MPEDDYNPYGEISFVIAHLGMLSESKKVEAYDMAQQVAKGMLS